MREVFDKETGKKMYPVGKLATYQHVFYNYNDRMYNRMMDEEHSEESCNAFDDAERFLQICDTNVYDGFIYALYEDYSKMKDITGAYALRHNGRV